MIYVCEFLEAAVPTYIVVIFCPSYGVMDIYIYICTREVRITSILDLETRGAPMPLNTNYLQTSGFAQALNCINCISCIPDLLQC